MDFSILICKTRLSPTTYVTQAGHQLREKNITQNSMSVEFLSHIWETTLECKIFGSLGAEVVEDKPDTLVPCAKALISV